MAKTCQVCGASGGIFSGVSFEMIAGKVHCNECADKYREDAVRNIIISSTPSLDGYRVKQYLGIQSAETVQENVFCAVEGGQLQKAQQKVFDALKLKAVQAGGNAVIGIDMDYIRFSEHRFGVIASGTVVKIVPLDSVPQRDQSKRPELARSF